MDPCPFVRLIIESLALKLPSVTKPAGSAGVHPSTTPCYVKLKLNNNFPTQTSLVPLSTDLSPPQTTTTTFHLDPNTLERLVGKAVIMKLYVYNGSMRRSCGVMTRGKILGELKLSIELISNVAQVKHVVYHKGWMKLGGDHAKPGSKIHVVVRSEPDPRFVFQFGGEPECSPVVFQIQGNIRQPVFSCKFSPDRNNRSRSLPSDFTINTRGWMRTFSGDGLKPGKERKGWMIIVYDLSGSAVAAASMITPFVASPGSDRVSRLNPGAWLILRPNGASVSSWKPWGRLEAWRERGSVDRLGYKFELIATSGLTSGIPIAEGTMNVKKGGRFCIDNAIKDSTFNTLSPIRGFVMGANVEGEGKVSKPTVEVAVKHVTCIGDAALFVALSAAIDLSMDACRLFTQKLRKEFSIDEQEQFP